MFSSSMQTVDVLDRMLKSTDLQLRADRTASTASTQGFDQIFEQKLQNSSEKTTDYAVRDRSNSFAERSSSEDRAVVRDTEKPKAAEKKSVSQNKPTLKQLKSKLDELNKKLEDSPDDVQSIKDAVTELKKIIAAVSDPSGNDSETTDTTTTAASSTTSTDPSAVSMQQIMDLLKGTETSKSTDSTADSTAQTATTTVTGALDGDSAKDVLKTLKQTLNLLDAKLQKVADSTTESSGSSAKTLDVFKNLLSQMKQLTSGETTNPKEDLNKLNALLNKLNVQGNATVTKTPTTDAPIVQEAAKTETVQASVKAVAPDSKVSTPENDEPAMDKTAGSVKVASTTGNTSAKTSSDTSENGTKDGAKSNDTLQPFQMTGKADAKETPSDVAGSAKNVKVLGPTDVRGEIGKPQMQSGLQSNPEMKEILAVADETNVVRTSAPVRTMDQVMEAIKTQWKPGDGKSEMVLQLKPESLGQVSLKVSIEKGIVVAQFQVDSQTVKQALEANLTDLRNALHDKGFNVYDLDVSVRKDSQQSGSGFQESQQNRKGRSSSPVEALTTDNRNRAMASLESVYQDSTIDYRG